MKCEVWAINYEIWSLNCEEWISNFESSSGKLKHWENLTVACEQHRRSSACASAQSDQRLCCSLSGRYNIPTSTMQSFNILTSLCSWAGWFEFDAIGNLKDRFSGVEIYMVIIIWATAWDFQQCGMCEQLSLRSVCAYAQSDQSLC